MSGAAPAVNWSRDLVATEDMLTVSLEGWDKLTDDERKHHPITGLRNKVAEAFLRQRAEDIVRAHTVGVSALVLTTEDEVLSRPSPEWLVDGVIQENTLCLFAGPGGIGKTFWSLDLARTVAAGGKFFGREVKQGKVLYVAAEGTHAFGDRVRAWNSMRGTMHVPTGGITYVESGVNLSDPDSVTRLAELVKSGDYALVVLDTLSQLAHFDNENNNAEIARVFLQIKRLRDARPGTAILIVDHTPAQGGKARGGTAKRDNSDTAIVASRESEGFTVSTRAEDGGKQKDGEEFAWVGFALQSVGSSAVVTNSGKRAQSPHWATVAAVLIDGEKHKAAELREACGIQGDARTGPGKSFAIDLGKWMQDGLIEKHGATANTTYSMTTQALAVLS